MTLHLLPYLEYKAKSRVSVSLVCTERVPNAFRNTHAAVSKSSALSLKVFDVVDVVLFGISPCVNSFKPE